MDPSIDDAVRELIATYVSIGEKRSIPYRPVEHMTRDVDGVHVESRGLAPAPELLVDVLDPRESLPDHVHALSAALTTRLGSQDAAKVDPELAAYLLARRHLRLHGVAVSPQALDESVRAFTGFLDHQSIQERFVATLDNFTSDEAEVRVADDVVLHLITDQERHQIWNERRETLKNFDPFAVIAVARWTHLMYVELRCERFETSNTGALQERAEHVVTGLRLQHGGSVQSTWKWREWLPPVADFAEALRPRPMSGTLFGPKIPSRDVFVLDASDAAELPVLVAQVQAHDLTERSFELALRRFNGAYSRGPLEDRVIDAWVALEALFAPDAHTELKFRASSRIARFIGHNQAERIEIQKFLRLSYDVRSHLVHGGAPDQLGSKVNRAGGLAAVADGTEDMLRRALREWIKEPRAAHSVVAAIDQDMMS